MNSQKGQWHLLRAVKELIGDGLPIHLLILGEGELREALEREAARLKIENAVTFAGFVENPYKYMAHADAVVIPSLYEGFSNVMIEALACGAPVISTDDETGAREILAPDTDHRVKVKDRIDEAAYGILVPVCEGAIGENSHNDTVQESFMAEAIRRILTDGDLAAGMADAGHQVTVVTMGFPGLPAQTVTEDVTVFRLKCLRRNPHACMPWEAYTYITAAKRFLDHHLKEHAYAAAAPSRYLLRLMHREMRGGRFVWIPNGTAELMRMTMEREQPVRGTYMDISGYDCETVCSKYLRLLKRAGNSKVH